MRSLTTLARCVVDAPELLRLISDFAEHNDHVNLLCVSRRVFACVSASLWEDVRDVTMLLKLLPGVTIVKEEKSSKVCSYQIIFSRLSVLFANFHSLDGKLPGHNRPEQIQHLCSAGQAIGNYLRPA